jgi:primosomal protein N''
MCSKNNENTIKFNIPRELNDLLSQLIARLPELEWKINGLGSFFSNQSLPRELFRRDTEPTGTACVAEIKADLHALSRQKNERSAFYLAWRISQKINVLVVLCHMQNRKKKPEEKVSFGIKMLSTRQQWIHDLEVEITTLIGQQQAMTTTLEYLTNQHHSDAILHLKAELGELERRLTLAKEALARAIF